MDKGKFELHYFAGNGRAAVARAILSYAKADWKDVRFNHEEWPKIKTSGLCEFGQAPILVHNGKKFAQSAAIYLYLARVFDIYGKSPEEDYQIDSLIASIEDLNPVFYPVIFPRTEEQKKNLDKTIEVFEEKFGRYLQVYEKRYAANGNGKYFLGEKFTLADVFCAVCLTAYSTASKKELMKQNAPKVNELVERVKENELKEFFEKYYVK